MTIRRRGLLVLACLAGFLTGCWDRSQLEDRYYVIKLGLDRRPDGQVLVSAQIAMTPYLSAGLLHGSAESTEAMVACHTLATVANSIPQAMHMLNASLTRSLTLRHLRAVLVGEELGRDGVEPVLMQLWRDPEARGTPLVAQVRAGTAHDVLQECKPLGEVNVARVPEGILSQQKRFHLSPPIRLHQFLMRLAAPGGDPIMPVVALNPNMNGTPADLSYTGESVKAGEMPRLGGNAFEFLGTAIYHEDKLVGFLNVDETQMLLALRGEMGKTYVSFPDPAVPDRLVSLRFQQENLPKYQVWFVDGKPRVKVRILLEGEVLAIPSGTDYVPPDARKRLEVAAVTAAETTLRQLLSRLRQWEADPVGFGHLFRGHFANWDQWTAHNWEDRVGDLQVDVTVDMRIRRYGLYTGPDRTRGGG